MHCCKVAIEERECSTSQSTENFQAKSMAQGTGRGSKKITLMDKGQLFLTPLLSFLDTLNIFLCVCMCEDVGKCPRTEEQCNLMVYT